MPIETTAAGILDIENAKLRASELMATASIGIGANSQTDIPFKIKTDDPAVWLQEGTSTSAGKLLAKSGVLHIQSGTAFTNDSKGDIAFSSIGDVTRHMTITGSTGYVGIGTSPGAKLDIFSSSTDPGAVPTLHIGDGAVDYGDYGMLQLTRHPTTGGSKAHAAFIRNGNSVFGMGYHNNTNTFGLWSSFSTVTNTPTMSFTSGGNVGIGTTSPLEKLDVYGVGRMSSAYPRLDFFCTTGRSTNNWGDSTGAAGDYRIYSNSDASDGTKRSLNFDYGQNAVHTTRMCINAVGNVGIGTTSPLSTFQIGTNTDVVYANNPLDDNTVSIFGKGVAPTIAANSDMNATLFLTTNDAFAENKGSSIALAARHYNFGGGNQHLTCARISGVASGGFSGDFVVETQNGGSLYERMRIFPNGKVSFNSAGIANVTGYHFEGAADRYLTRNNASGTTNSYTGILLASRPGQTIGTNSASFVVFSNGADRSADNGANSTTVRNDSGNLYLGRSGYDTYVYNANHTTFTGQHVCHAEGDNLEEGFIVCSNKNDYVSLNDGLKRGINGITINESVPIVGVSSRAFDPTCFGVISRVEELNTPYRHNDQHGTVTMTAKERGDNRIVVNSLGEGAIWIANTNGPLLAGDFITTSNIAGYGQNQGNDIFRSSTVAKITMDCDFNPITRPKKIIKQELSNVYLYDNGTSKDKYYVGDSVLDGGEYESNEENDIIFRTVDKTFEIKEELVNVLDEHGQLQWEDHPTETEKAYKIRYLTADGTQTDEANAVHIAAFVGCTYHCG